MGQQALFASARGVPHAWCNSSRAPVLAVFSPGGIEQLFREIAGGRDAVFDDETVFALGQKAMLPNVTGMPASPP
jgi:hypothetical protein